MEAPFLLIIYRDLSRKRTGLTGTASRNTVKVNWACSPERSSVWKHERTTYLAQNDRLCRSRIGLPTDWKNGSCVFNSSLISRNQKVKLSTVLKHSHL